MKVSSFTSTLSHPTRFSSHEDALGVSCAHVTLGYDRTPVIKDLSFALPPGGSLAIVGESGCGKSTLLTALARADASVN